MVHVLSAASVVVSVAEGLGCCRVWAVSLVAMVTFPALSFSAEVRGDAAEAGDVVSQLWTSHGETHEVSRTRCRVV